MKFSVLMSVYNKEKSEFFDRCMHSIWNEQIVKPNQIVLVEDGYLNDELYQSIYNWKEKLGDCFITVSLENNLGLGDALNKGLEKCSYPLIARMDTDDIAMPERFEKQLKIFSSKKVDVCSSWVSEFEDDENMILSYRKVPENHNEIVQYAKKRNPLNHPAVMYRKSAVIQAGKYQKKLWFEDYWLWVSMILNGTKFYNIQYPLVKMRAGYKQLERRSGIKYAISEFNFQRQLLDTKFINHIEYIRNLSIRLIVRIIPKYFIGKIYKILRN